jgi:outer membrane murein-binding lipoprotein Lpp
VSGRGQENSDQEGERVKLKILAIFCAVVLLGCSDGSGREEANKKIEELQVKIVDLQTEISHLRRTNAELNAQLQARRQ